MAFSYGFYNSVNHDRVYDAIQMSSIFDGIINDGVYATYGDHYMIRENPSEADSVIVGTGRAWFDHTWNLNDAALLLYGDRSEIMMDRWDAIVIDVNENTRTNQILWIKGAPGSNPNKPTLVNMLGHRQYPLAFLLRKPGSTVVEQRYIENAVGTSKCPFVTGIIETIDIDDLIMQWTADWRANVLKYYNDTVAFGDRIKQLLEKFERAQESEFTNWFFHIKDILNESAAGNLLNLIDANAELEFKRYYELFNSTTNINETSNTITKTVGPDTITTTIENRENGIDVITTTINVAREIYLYIRSTTIVPISTGSNISTVYTKTAK